MSSAAGRRFELSFINDHLRSVRYLQADRRRDMQITIPEDVEERLKSRAKAFGYENVEEYVLNVLLEDEERPGGTTRLSKEQWQREFRDLVGSLTPGNPNFDDSRESIYRDVSSCNNPYPDLQRGRLPALRQSDGADPHSGDRRQLTIVFDQVYRYA
jgi:hypothetical protein